MRTVRTIAELRAALAEDRRGGRRIGLVPTMGAFHAGHLSLIAHARVQCDVVVVSLFVNPTQFNDGRDLAAYPRDEARDAAQAEDAGVDFLFAPSVDDVYPVGFSTTVSVRGLTKMLEGAHRGIAHFDGVATVVAKLLNIVAPDIAYFGQKDAQQTLVVRRLVRDLEIPVQIEICPTVRDADGLALSSRNVLLSVDERRRAAALYRALSAVQDAVSAGERDPAAAIRRGRAELTAAQLEPDYLELVSLDTLRPVAQIDGDALAVIAVRVGSTRLIDNLEIRVPSARTSGRARVLSARSARPDAADHPRDASSSGVRGSAATASPPASSPCSVLDRPGRTSLPDRTSDNGRP